MNATDARTVEETVATWEAEGKKRDWDSYLIGVDNPHIRLTTKVVLENQYLYNTFEEYHPAKCDILLRTVARVFPSLLIHKIASVQPMLGPAGLTYCTELQYEKDANGNVVNEVHSANGTTWEMPKYIFPVVPTPTSAKSRNLGMVFSTDVDAMSTQLKQIIDKEHLTDLWNNAGTLGTIEPGKSFAEQVPQISMAIKRKTMIFDKYWIVVGRELYEREKDGFDRWNQWSSLYSGKLYVVDGWDKTGVLIGVHSPVFHHHEYSWNPYVLLSPLTKDPQGRTGILCRYGKKLRSGKPYGRIALK